MSGKKYINTTLCFFRMGISDGSYLSVSVPVYNLQKARGIVDRKMLFNWLKHGFNRHIAKEPAVMAEHDNMFEAMADFEDGNFSDAVYRLHDICRKSPDHPLANIMLARALLHFDQYPRAIETLERHLAFVNEKSPEALLYLGVAYFDLGDIQKSIQYFEKAWENGAGSRLIRENLALGKFRIGRLADALDDLMALYELDPDDRAISLMILKILGKLGKWESARIYHRENSKS